MSYATQADLLQRMTTAELTQLTDDNRPPAVINAAVVQGELDEATATIDSYCRARYVTPLQTSNTVVSLCRDLATYGLYSRRNNQNMPEVVEKRYLAAIAMLKDIAAGKAQLDQPAGAAVPQTFGGEAVLPTHRHEVFSERHLEGYV